MPCLISTSFVFLCLLFPVMVRSNEQGSKVVQLTNDSMSNLTVSWIHPETDEKHCLTDKTGLQQGDNIRLSTRNGHRFIIEELPGTNGLCGPAPNQKCRSKIIQVSQQAEEKLRVTTSFKVEVAQKKIDKSSVEYCQVVANEALAKKPTNAKVVEKITKDLAACVEKRMTLALNDEIKYQTKKRRELGKQWERYACADDGLATSAPLETTSWVGGDGVEYTVSIMHSRPASQIRVIENFIQPDECRAIDEAARDNLEECGVFNPFTGKRFKTPNRKALQAKLSVPWETEDHPFIRLSQRVFNYTKEVMDLDIPIVGQEPLRHIKYEGRGRDEKEPDQFVSHCDDRCDGKPYQPGRRIASMIMYCEVADSGGYTVFRNAGIGVEPKVGRAVFFSYINTRTMEMDDGETEHAGCPVYEGSKKVATQWIRLGVDEEHPWHTLNNSDS